MSRPGPVEDYFVNIRSPDSVRLQQAQQNQLHLDYFPGWPKRSDSAFLMRTGENLFAMAFPTVDDVADLATVLASAARADAILRLWIHAGEPQLAMLPWEFICLTQEAVEACQVQGLKIDKYQPHTRMPEDHTFLALHPNVSLIRQPNEDLPKARLERIGALKVLMVWANPGSDAWPTIAGIEAEAATIRAQLSKLPASHVEVCVVERATREALESMLRKWRPNVLHFAGHGAFPGAPDDPGDLPGPSLVLEGTHASSHHIHDYLTAAELRTLCAECGVQVVVLNSCWGARTGPRFTGIAHALTATGTDVAVQAVVAHQAPVPQAAAASFAGPFYQNVALACPIEDGVRTFRQDCLKNPYGAGVPDWGIPVVFLGVRDSTLFQSIQFDVYPINFGELIRQHVPIVGREFLRQRLSEFQEKRERLKAGGIFLLTAPPGTGKTAFVAQLASGDPAPVHFFYRHTAGVTDPDECVRSLHRGLLGRYGILEENPTSDPRELRRRLEQILDKIPERCAGTKQRELILLDSLDESGRTYDGKNAVETLPARLPEHVCFLVTSRPVPLADILARRPDTERLDLDPSSNDNLRDAAAFCRRELEERVASESGEALARVCENLARQAEGNFLVLKLFLDRDTLGQQVSLDELSRAAVKLTGKIEDRYEEFFERIAGRLVSDDQLGRLYDVLGAFATARGPVTPEQVCTAFGLKKAGWDWTFRMISQFLERGGLRQEERGTLTYRLYHETFREFLLKKLAIDVAQHHRQWAEYNLCWRDLRGFARLYALRHLPMHLIEASRGD